MRRDDFFIVDDNIPDIFGPEYVLNADLLKTIRLRPLSDREDAEVAVALTRLVHDELEAFGTGGGTKLDEEEIRAAILAMYGVLDRLGVNLRLPFRDYSGFHTWWIDNDAHGSYQARRSLLNRMFDPVHDQLSDMELRSLTSSLTDPISPHARTGWPAVDIEISELRRHFSAARTPQDYRNVGHDCVSVTEALSRTVYDVDRHLRHGEEEPPVAKTKERIGRFVEDAAPGPDNAALRKVARAVIELAQHVKHSETPTRREAGIAADAVIQLSNMLRRLDEPE